MYNFTLKRVSVALLIAWLTLFLCGAPAVVRAQTAGVFKATAANGSTVYTVLLNVTGSFYNAVTPGFESEADADWTSTKYCLAMAQKGTSQIYLGSMPASIAAGHYSYIVFQQAGANPAETDTIIAQGAFDWTGSAIASVGISLPANIPAGSSGGLPLGNGAGYVTVATNNDKSGYSLATAPPTAAAIASSVWQDTTAGDFTVASSIGKLFLGGAALSATAPGWYGPPTTAQIAAAILSNPANLLVTDGSGRVNLNLNQLLDTTVLPFTNSSVNSVNTAFWASITGQGLGKVSISGSTMSLYDVTESILIRAPTLSPTPTANSSKQ